MSQPERSATRIPADVERPDSLVFGLTLRQLVIVTVTLAVAGGLAWLTARLTPLPLAVVAGLTIPVVAAGVGMALGQRDGLGLDRWVWAALRQARAPRHRVAAPEGIPDPPEWLASTVTQPPKSARPAPLTHPATDLHPSGVVDLGRDGAALVCQATPVNLALRTLKEQAALVAAFARFLNQLTGPTQVLIRAHPADLTARIHQLTNDAAGLPHPALEQAATQHASFLTELAHRREVFARELLVVFRDPTPNATTSHTDALHRRAQEAASLLAVAGVSLTALDEPAAATALAAPPPPGAAG